MQELNLMELVNQALFFFKEVFREIRSMLLISLKMLFVLGLTFLSKVI